MKLEWNYKTCQIKETLVDFRPIEGTWDVSSSEDHGLLIELIQLQLKDRYLSNKPNSLINVELFNNDGTSVSDEAHQGDFLAIRVG